MRRASVGVPPTAAEYCTKLDAGTWAAFYGTCTVNGQQCQESSFVQTGKCP